MEATSLPSARLIAIGVINQADRVIPVVEMRKRFRVPEKGLHPEDRLIIGRTARRRAALLVDSASALAEISADHIIDASAIPPWMDYVEDIGANAYIVRSSFGQNNLLEVIRRLI